MTKFSVHCPQMLPFRLEEVLSIPSVNQHCYLSSVQNVFLNYKSRSVQDETVIKQSS